MRMKFSVAIDGFSRLSLYLHNYDSWMVENFSTPSGKKFHAYLLAGTYLCSNIIYISSFFFLPFLRHLIFLRECEGKTPDANVPRSLQSSFTSSSFLLTSSGSLSRALRSASRITYNVPPASAVSADFQSFPRTPRSHFRHFFFRLSIVIHFLTWSTLRSRTLHCARNPRDHVDCVNLAAMIKRIRLKQLSIVVHK